MISNLVSILMPVYNNKQYIVEAVQSILKQTHTYFELIIIDDASTDGNMDQITAIKDKRIKIIQNNAQKGISYSLNRGLAFCSGEFIARMDSDDICYNERLSKQIMYMAEHPEVTILGTNIRHISKNGKFIMEHHYSETDNKIKADLFFGKTPLAHPTIFMRHDFAEKNKLKYDTEIKYAEDFDLYCRYSKSCIFANLTEILLDYRQHPGSVSIEHRVQQRIYARKILKRYLNSLGIILTEKEFQAHCSFYLPLSTDSIDTPFILNWINKLASYNNCDLFQTEYFKEKLFQWKYNIIYKEKK